MSRADGTGGRRARHPLGRLASAVLLGIVLAPATPAAAATPADPAVHPPTGSEAFVARVVTATPVRAGAGTGRVLFNQSASASWGGGPVRLLVTRALTRSDGRRWLQVVLPSRPNARRGWILADDTRLTRTPWRVDVGLRARTVTVLRGGRRLRRFAAVVGAPGTPTPTGLSAVYEVIRQADPAGYTGPFALHLTAHSTVLENYGGGPGRVALHGRGAASLGDRLGTARSHGCVRVDNRQIRWLAAHAVPGTPVVIRP